MDIFPGQTCDGWQAHAKMINVANHQVLVRIWRKGNLHTLLLGMLIGMDTVEGNVEDSQKLRIELSYDPVIPLLGIHLKKKNKTKTLIQKDIRIPMFVVSLPTVAKIQRQQMMEVSINRWVDGEDTHTQNGILLSYKREWDFAICNDMDGLEGYLAKWIKSYRERQILHHVTYM